MQTSFRKIVALALCMALCISLLPVSAAAGDSTPPEVETVYNSATEAAEAVRQAVLAQEESITVCVAFDSDEFEDEEEGNAAKLAQAQSIEEQIRQHLHFCFHSMALGDKPYVTFGACSSRFSWYSYEGRYAAKIEYAFVYPILESREEAVTILAAAWSAKKYNLTMYIKDTLPDGVEPYDQMQFVWNDIVNLTDDYAERVADGDVLSRYLASNPANTNYYFENDEYISAIYIPFDFSTDEAVDRELARVMAELELDGKNEYEKVCAVYSYITSTVIYDTLGENPRRYSVYGALIDKLAVCDGISQLMYLMMRSIGVDCRIIIGDIPTIGRHSWNIVRIGDYYYNVDVTLDWGLPPEGWKWFLQSDYSFERGHEVSYNPYDDPYYYDEYHLRDSKYTTEEFTSSYPVSPLDYGDDAVWMVEGESYDISLEANSTASFVFQPDKSGRYTFLSSDAARKADVHITSIQKPIDTRESETGNDFSNTYRLIQGNQYRFEISFRDKSQPGTLSVCIVKNPTEEVIVTDATVEDLMFYEGDWVYAWGRWGTYRNYSPMKAAATVVLSNGEVLQASLGDVIEYLNDIYELDVPIKATGDFQRGTYQWGIGRYPLSIKIGDVTADFCVTVVKNPIKSVETEPLPARYDDDYTQTIIDGVYYADAHYLYTPGSITVVTDEKTYEGPYKEVYQQVCADLNYEFPFITDFKISIDVGLGIHDVEVRLFGVQTAWHVEILKANPVGTIIVPDRVVTESDRREIEIEVPDGNGGTQTVTYLAYPCEPHSVKITYKNSNNSFTGTLEEVMDHLASTLDYHETFVYTGGDTPDAPWTGPGKYTVTISLGDVSAEYSVIVKSEHELTVGGIAEEEVTKPGEIAYFTFTPEESAVYKFTSIGDVDPEDLVYSTIYDHGMQLLTSGWQRGDGGFNAAYTLEAGKTYYLGVNYYSEKTGTIAVTVQKLFEVRECTVQKDLTVYEIEGSPTVGWVGVNQIQYLWYDLYPKGNAELYITAEPYVFRGTFKEVTDAMWERYGILPNFQITDDQSVSSPWTAGNTYDARVSFWGNDYEMKVKVKAGPILSLEAEDTQYVAGTGREETGPNGDTWQYYNTRPALLTAHTVDGDISGTPEEIRDHIRDVYGMTLGLIVAGDDQYWENPWGAGLHDMMITLGSITADYRVIIEKAESLSVSGKFKTDYLVGEAFDPSGIMVTAALSSGGLVDVTEFALFTGFDSASAGEKTVFVRCGGSETSFTAAVRNRVMLTVLGDIRHEAEYPEDIHGLAAGGLTEWLTPAVYASDSGETAYELAVRALSGSDVLSLVLRTHEQNGIEYIYAVGNGGLTLSEGDNHANSGWFIAVNGTAVGDASQVTLSDGDTVTLYWCDDRAADLPLDMRRAVFVMALIDAVGGAAPGNEAAIIAARAAYNALTDEQKALVTNYDMLLTAEAGLIYTVTYNANGGSGAPEPQTKAFGDTLTLSTTEPTRTDESVGSFTVSLDATGGSVSPTSLTAARTTKYTFDNWNTQKDGSGTNFSVGADYNDNADLTLYAQWTSRTTTAAVTLPTPTRDGYTFKGWGTSMSGSINSDVTGSYTPVGDVTLYAVWEQNAPTTYLISYDANGGTGAPAAQTKKHGDTLILSSTKPTREDAATDSCTVTFNANGGSVDVTSLTANRITKYTFDSWNNKPDGSGTYYSAGGSYTANAAVMLYAQWTGSTTTAEITLPTPVRDGYTFKGWGTSANATSGVTGSYTPVGDVTLYAVWEQDATPPTELFTDVSNPSEYYYDAVYWARDNGITTGRTPTTFDPYAPCTRGQIVTFLWRMMGEPEPASSFNPFTDVKPGDYFYNAVLWAYYRGITTGKTAMTFQPYSPCTREQSVTFLWRAAGKPGSGGGNPFGDVKTGTYYYDAVRWAVANGITTGRTATVFGVGQACTRAQIVTFLYRYAN